MKKLPYKIEMHIHTSQASPCANIKAEDMVAMYAQAGYDTLVITDHYNKWVLDQSKVSSPEEYVDYFLSGYFAAKEAAKNTSCKVILGAEVNLTESPNDYLLYGCSEDFFRKNLSLHELTLPELSALCHENNILLFQAHPFRTYCEPSDASLLDGAEYYNGNPRHNNRNDMAQDWGETHQLIPSSGSDFHEAEDLAKGGICTKVLVESEAQLRELLLSGDYKWITI